METNLSCTRRFQDGHLIILTCRIISTQLEFSARSYQGLNSPLNFRFLVVEDVTMILAEDFISTVRVTACVCNYWPTIAAICWKCKTLYDHRELLIFPIWTITFHRQYRIQPSITRFSRFIWYSKFNFLYSCKNFEAVNCERQQLFYSFNIKEINVMLFTDKCDSSRLPLLGCWNEKKKER